MADRHPPPATRHGRSSGLGTAAAATSAPSSSLDASRSRPSSGTPLRPPTGWRPARPSPASSSAPFGCKPPTRSARSVVRAPNVRSRLAAASCRASRSKPTNSSGIRSEGLCRAMAQRLPMLLRSTKTSPVRGDWILEPKWDGYRFRFELSRTASAAGPGTASRTAARHRHGSGGGMCARVCRHARSPGLLPYAPSAPPMVGDADRQAVTSAQEPALRVEAMTLGACPRLFEQRGGAFFGSTLTVRSGRLRATTAHA
jgi:hypothetical protein